MRIGTVGLGRIGTSQPDATLVISGSDMSGWVDPGIIPGTPQSGGYTSGPSVNGDTLMCPPAHPYDYVIHDCSGWEGSNEQAQVMALQAAMDVCSDSGRLWDEANRRCIVPRSTIIPGIPNGVFYAATGLLLLTALRGKKR